MISFFKFIYLMNYIHLFYTCDPSLNPWSEANLVMINDLLAMIVNLVCKYSIENICIFAYQEGQSGPHGMETSILTAISNTSVKTFFYPAHVGPGLGEEVVKMSKLKIMTLPNPCLALYNIDDKWNLFRDKGLHSLCGVVAGIRSITIAKNYI